jgi:hypothetical protein
MSAQKNSRPCERLPGATWKRDVSPFPHRRNGVGADREQPSVTVPSVEEYSHLVDRGLGEFFQSHGACEADDVCSRGEPLGIKCAADAPIASGALYIENDDASHLKPPCSRNGDKRSVPYLWLKVKRAAGVSGAD